MTGVFSLSDSRSRSLSIGTGVRFSGSVLVRTAVSERFLGGVEVLRGGGVFELAVNAFKGDLVGKPLEGDPGWFSFSLSLLLTLDRVLSFSVLFCVCI